MQQVPISRQTCPNPIDQLHLPPHHGHSVLFHLLTSVPNNSPAFCVSGVEFNLSPRCDSLDSYYKILD